MLRDLCGVRSSPEGGKCYAPLDLLKEDTEVSLEELKQVSESLKYVRKNDILEASFPDIHTTGPFLQEVVVPAKVMEAPVLAEVADRIRRK